jgi:TRAP transporter TAXI family solute receptor
MKFTTFLAAVGLAVSSVAGHADPLNLTLSGGSPGGLWSLLGAGIDRAVKQDDPSSVITYQATGGGFANVGLLASGRTDLGLVHDAESKIALNGTAPFTAPVTNLRSIGYMYNWAPMHFFLDKKLADKYNIDSLDDIAASGAPLRIGINRPGNITGEVALEMLAAAGATEEVIEANGGQLVRAGSGEQADLIQDGRLDMISNGIFILHSSFRAVDQNNDVILLTVPDDVIEATNAKFGTKRMLIPAHSYSKQEGDVYTSSLGALLLTSDKMSEEVAHSLTASLVKNIDEIRAVHSSMKALSPELLQPPAWSSSTPGPSALMRRQV